MNAEINTNGPADGAIWRVRALLETLRKTQHSLMAQWKQLGPLDLSMLHEDAKRLAAITVPKHELHTVFVAVELWGDNLAVRIGVSHKELTRTATVSLHWPFQT